mgnify:CR=1 FL=1
MIHSFAKQERHQKISLKLSFYHQEHHSINLSLDQGPSIQNHNKITIPNIDYEFLYIFEITYQKGKKKKKVLA